MTRTAKRSSWTKTPPTATDRGWLVLVFTLSVGLSLLYHLALVAWEVERRLEPAPLAIPATFEEEWESKCDLDTMQGNFAEPVCSLRSL